MIDHSEVCDERLIAALVEGHLDSRRESELADHLDACRNCRESLDIRTGRLEEWQETVDLLKEHPFDADSSSFVIDAPSDHSGNTIESPSIRHVLEMLAPTDDPRMLGRLGHYEVSGVVGAGGMGVVLKAVDPPLDRTVAIKVLAPHLASSGAARVRFAREAKAAAAVLHPNVIAIHGVSDSDERTMLPYLVMPYVRGASWQ